MRRWVLAAAVALGGCSADIATFSEQRDMAARWEAQNIAPANFKADLIAYMRIYLNNPEHVRSASLSPPQLRTVGPGQRFVTCVQFDARDSVGKYMGVKVGAAVYVFGKLDQFIDRPKEAREICKDAAYAPFPELEKLTR